MRVTPKCFQSCLPILIYRKNCSACIAILIPVACLIITGWLFDTVGLHGWSTLEGEWSAVVSLAVWSHDKALTFECSGDQFFQSPVLLQVQTWWRGAFSLFPIAERYAIMLELYLREVFMHCRFAVNSKLL